MKWWIGIWGWGDWERTFDEGLEELGMLVASNGLTILAYSGMTEYPSPSLLFFPFLSFPFRNPLKHRNEIDNMGHTICRSNISLHSWGSLFIHPSLHPFAFPSSIFLLLVPNTDCTHTSFIISSLFLFSLLMSMKQMTKAI